MTMSPTQYSMIVTCPRKWWYRYVEKRELPTTQAQSEGKSADEWLNAYYRGEEPPFESAFLDLYAEHFDPFKGWEVVAVQPEYDGIFADLLVRTPTGHLCVVDHKFLSQCPRVDEVQEEHQFIMYTQRSGADFFILNWLKRGVDLIDPVYNKDGSLSARHKNYRPPFGKMEHYREWFKTVKVTFSETDFANCQYDLDMAEKMSKMFTEKPYRAKQSGFSSPCKFCGYKDLCRGRYDYDSIWERNEEEGEE